MATKFEAFTVPDGAVAAAEQVAQEINVANHFITAKQKLKEWSMKDLLGAFPLPGSEGDDGSAERYFQMVTAAVSGNRSAALAYKQTAINFRPVNQPILSAVRNHYDAPGSWGDPSGVSTLGEVDAFGRCTDSGGMALRGLWFALSAQQKGPNTYKDTALQVVRTVVLPARLSIAAL